MKNKSILIIATLFGLSNTVIAGPSGAAIPSRKPTKNELLEATAPGYVMEKSLKSECLGRLVFDLQGQIEWPTSHRHQSGVSLESRKFSEEVYQQGDKINFGNMAIAVVGPLNKKLIDSLHSEFPENRLVSLKQSLKEEELYLNKAIKDGATDRKSRYARSESEVSIQVLKKSISKISAENESFEPGILNSYGFWKRLRQSDEESNSIYRAYIFGGNYAYVFESKENYSTAAAKETQRRKFLKILADFRERKQNEVPGELGLCIPYGFLPDDGKTTSDIQQSIRWTDTPGVLYTIHTGTVDPRDSKSPVIEAIATAAIGLMGSTSEADMKRFVTERIGPRLAKIGGLTAQQGGVALKVSETGKTPYEVYSVFTGYGGWLGTSVLPYILVEMTTRTMEQAPELKANPPPFKQSMGRLNTLLKSTRLRPTTPAMPELVNVQKEK